MTFCEQCGTKFNAGEKFCSGCGKAVPAEVATVIPAAAIPAENVLQAEPAGKLAFQPAGKPCRGCGKRLDADWLACPFCKTEAGPKKCVSCKKELEDEWVVCPFCKTEL